jgi:hypothetical protein
MELNQALTLLVAIGVALIGYFQWRTANQRVVMDLFDRRFQVFDKLEGVVLLIVQHGKALDEDFRAAAQAKAEARFLFGKDVQEYVQRIIEDIAFMNTYTSEVIDSSSNREQLLNKRTAVMTRLSKFFSEAPVVFRPYIGLDQRNTSFWRPW